MRLIDSLKVSLDFRAYFRTVAKLVSTGRFRFSLEPVQISASPCTLTNSVPCNAVLTNSTSKYPQLIRVPNISSSFPRPPTHRIIRPRLFSLFAGQTRNQKTCQFPGEQKSRRVIAGDIRSGGFNWPRPIFRGRRSGNKESLGITSSASSFRGCSESSE